MRKNSETIVGPVTTKFIKDTLVKFLLTSVYAEGDDGEGNDEGDGEPVKTPTLDFEAMLAKVRKEEKDKQYNTIQKLKGQIETFTKQHNSDLLTISGLQDEVKELKDKLSTPNEGDSETVKTLKKENDTLIKERDTLAKELAELRAIPPVDASEIEEQLRTQISAEYELKTYKATKLLELGDQILVPELIVGETKEDLDASIASALERSKAIKQQLGLSEESKNKNKRVPKNPANPSSGSNVGGRYATDYIASLDPSSEEYKSFRKEMGLL